MTSRLNTMTSAAERLNRSLDTTDALSDTIDPGAPFERSAGDGRPPGRQLQQQTGTGGARREEGEVGLVEPGRRH